MAKVYFDVRQIISRNYGKYAKPEPPRLLEEVAELYSKIADSKFKLYLNERHMYFATPCGDIWKFVMQEVRWIMI